MLSHVEVAEIRQNFLLESYFRTGTCCWPMQLKFGRCWNGLTVCVGQAHVLPDLVVGVQQLVVEISNWPWDREKRVTLREIIVTVQLSLESGSSFLRCIERYARVRRCFPCQI